MVHTVVQMHLIPHQICILIPAMLPEYQSNGTNIHTQCFLTSLICCVQCQCHCSDLPLTVAAPLKPEKVTGLSTEVDWDMLDRFNEIQLALQMPPDSGSPPHDRLCKSTVKEKVSWNWLSPLTSAAVCKPGLCSCAKGPVAQWHE